LVYKRRASICCFFFPQVDDFSSLIVPLTNQNTTNNTSTTNTSTTGGEKRDNENFRRDNVTDNSEVIFYNEEYVYIWLNLSGIVTTPRYFKTAVDTFAQGFTIIVTMDNGNITNVDWDDDKCSECNSDYYVSDNSTSGVGCNCGFKYSEVACSGTNGTDIVKQGTDANLCDLKIFLAWQGTAAKNDQLTSINYAPSQFEKYSALSVYQTAAGVASNQYIP